HPVIFGFIISGKNPYFSFEFYPYLGRSYNMTGRMKRKFHSVNSKALIPVFACNLDFSQPMFNYGYVGVVGNIFFVTPAGMICMPVGYECVFDRLPWVQVDVCLGTVNSVFIKSQ